MQPQHPQQPYQEMAPVVVGVPINQQQQQQQPPQHAQGYPAQSAPYLQQAHMGGRGSSHGSGEKCVEGMTCRAGKLCFGIPLYIHFLFPIIAIVSMAADAFRINSVDSSYVGQAVLMAFLVSGIALPITVLVHEMGHCTGAKLCNAHVSRILLWPLGGLAYIGEAETRTQEFIITILGPMTHIPMFLLFLGLSSWRFWKVYSYDLVENNKVIKQWPEVYYGDYFFENTMIRIQQMQIVLMAFNLLIPAFPLDGGRILVILLTNVCRPETTAWVSIVACCVCCAGLGVATLLMGGSIGMTFVICAWLLYNSYTVYQHIRAGQINSHPLFRRGQQ